MRRVYEAGKAYRKLASEGVVEAAKRSPKMKSKGLFGDLQDLGRDFAKGIRKGLSGK